MEQRPVSGMWGRYALFIVLSVVILAANAYLTSVLSPPRKVPPQAGGQVAQAAAKGPEKDAVAQAAPSKGPEKPAPEKPTPEKAGPPAAKGDVAVKPAAAAPKPAGPEPKAPEPKVPETWIALGSVDSAGPYRMLVTLTNRGAAVRRIELSSPRFHDLEDRSGYLGHVVVQEEIRGTACPVQVVGHGTPAAESGLAPGDAIKSLAGQPVTGYASLTEALSQTKPGQTVQVAVTRNGQEMVVPVTLGRRPLEVVRPENGAPPSFLVTIKQIDDQTTAPPGAAADEKAAAAADPGEVERELEGAALRNVNWEVVSQDQSHVEFRRVLPQWGLEVHKTFRLAQVAPEDAGPAVAKDYHLTMELEIRNLGRGPRAVAYHVDGPNGLPAEGWWYASKVGHDWGAAGLRDVIASFNNKPKVVTAVTIGKGSVEPFPVIQPMDYLGVDAQYFAAVLIPQRTDPGDIGFSEWQPLRYGKTKPDQLNLTNTSFRVTSTVREIRPDGSLRESFQVFAGPKRPALLDQYGMSNLITYGWFGPIARLLLAILHTFYHVIPNYGVAILMLTALVRSCMFPLSKKQALAAQKMQELQPEIKKIQEKYKNNLEARGRAQQELFRKHNYNPMGSCLLLFLQLPIFIGLYRALMVDVELRQAPLITEKIRWASNLAAPDMLFDWSGFMPEFITRGTGIFGLGPYFNLLPLLTVVLFLWQQKKTLPPPADEQQAMQQRIMQFMMIFIGIMFFKVASGLCVYFIASSLWSVAERKFLPKTAAAGSSPPAAASAVPRVSPGRDGSGPSRRKAKGKRG